jgi:hypothetical protein
VALMPRWRIPRRWRLVASVLVAAYTAAVGVLVALDQKISQKRFHWVHSDKLQVPIVAILVFLTLAEAIRKAVSQTRSSAEDDRRVGVRKSLSSAMVTAAETAGVSVSDVGIGLFLVQPGFLRRPERLVRVERVRIPDDLHESGIEFTKGKGAVGSCWENQTITHRDLNRINARYHDPGTIATRWTKMHAATTQGFTRREFTAVATKYSEVLAVPVMDNGRFVGCIALDRRWDHSETTGRCVFDDDATKKILGAAAGTVLADYKR